MGLGPHDPVGTGGNARLSPAEKETNASQDEKNEEDYEKFPHKAFLEKRKRLPSGGISGWRQTSLSCILQYLRRFQNQDAD
jgi:hypothetical protein